MTNKLIIISLQGYCEEHVDNMDSLCNTIAGDAPLFTMFRKDGLLVKCPFRGPHSFSYSKGDKGQVCEYPASYMDTCSDNKRLQLRYQACHDVQGSESSSKTHFLFIYKNLFTIFFQTIKPSVNNNSVHPKQKILQCKINYCLLNCCHVYLDRP